MAFLDFIKNLFNPSSTGENSRIDNAVSKFDEDISNVIALCVSLKEELKILKNEMREVGNSYSAKLLSNEKIDLFVKRYSNIVVSYDSACKEFSKADPILEKIMITDDDARQLASDVNTLVDEVKTSHTFTANFEGAVSYIFETLAPTIDRILEVCLAIKDKIREVPPPLK